MKGRLRALEGAVGRVEGFLEDDVRVAMSLVQIWRYEHSQTFDEGETYDRMLLAREIHAGNPDAFDEWKALMVAEVEYLDGRTEEWLSDLSAIDRRRMVTAFAMVGRRKQG